MSMITDDEKTAYDYLSHVPAQLKKNESMKSQLAGLIYEMKPPLIYVNFLQKKMEFLSKPVKYQDYLLLLVLNELSPSTNLLK